MILLACAESKNPVEGVATGSSSSNTPPIDMTGLSRFTGTLSVSGSLTPNGNIHIAFAGQANLSTAQAEFRILLPEVSAASRSGFDASYRVPVGTSMGSVASGAGAYTAGQPFAVETDVIIPAPGYYRVLATALKRSDEPITHDGQWVLDFMQLEKWLLITDAGGAITDDFDPDLLPANAVKAPGPLRLTASAQQSKPGSPPAVSRASAIPGFVEYQVLYFALDDSVYRPVASASTMIQYCSLGVHLVCEPEDVFRTDNVYTTDQGFFYVECTGDSYQGGVSTGDPMFSVQGSGAGFSGSFSSDCGASYQLFLGSGPSRIFENMNKSYYGSVALLGVARPGITVVLDPNADNSFYDPSNDRITIKSTSGADHIWGIQGKFIEAHEYGHAVQEKALGGNAASGNCPVPHFVDGAHNLQCAYSEGFADFHGAATRPDLADFAYRDEFEADQDFPGHHGLGNPLDGSIIEGAVAAFLYDLADPSNETHDSAQFAGSYIAQIIQTCQVNVTFVGWVRANGIDHLTYCFEQTVDPSITGSSTYFVTRSPDPTQESQSATTPPGWTQAKIRNEWVWNEYDKR